MNIRPTNRRASRALAAVSSALTALSVLAASPTAHAEPVPETERLVLYEVFVQENVTRSTLGGVNLALHPYGGTPTTVMTDTKGIEMHVVLSSCGKVVTERTSVMRGFDAFIYTGFGSDQRYYSPAPSALSDMIGPSLDYTLTVTEPGYDPYVFTGTTSAYTTRPTCADLAGDNAARIPVQAWSAKFAQQDAKVGSNLTISDTRAAGAHVGYVWTVKAKGKPARVVNRGYRTVRVQRGWKGKQVQVAVTITKGTGKRARVLTRTLRFGKAY